MGSESTSAFNPDSYSSALQATLPFAIVEELGLVCGYERSAKFSRGQLLANRYLLGIQTSTLSPDKVAHICRRLEMPESRHTEFLSFFRESNLVFLGCEVDEQNISYKMYAEFYERRRAELQTNPTSAEPVLSHVGFKWRPGENDPGRVAKYLWHPNLSPIAISLRMANIYDGMSPLSRELSEQIAIRAFSRAAEFIYLEIDEPPSPRRSFDLNTYPSELRVADVADILQQAAAGYGLSPLEFDRLLAHVGNLRLGHISGGVDRKGQDFLTIYYESAAASA